MLGLLGRCDEVRSYPWRRPGDGSPQLVLRTFGGRPPFLKRFGYVGIGPDRTPDEGSTTRPDEAGHPRVYEGDVLHPIEADGLVEFPSSSRRHGLPQVVVGVNAFAPFLPKTCPVRQIQVFKMDVRLRVGPLMIFDGLLIGRPGKDPHFAMTGGLVYPIPSNARLGPQPRLAGVCRE